MDLVLIHGAIEMRVDEHRGCRRKLLVVVVGVVVVVVAVVRGVRGPVVWVVRVIRVPRAAADHWIQVAFGIG